MFPHNPVRNETRGKSAISAWPLIKTAGEAKISGSFLQSKAPQTPPRILAGNSPEFSLYAPMRKAPAAEKFTAFIHRLCLSVSARRAGKRHRDFSPREESGSAGIFLRGDSADLSFSGAAGTGSAETFPCHRGTAGKAKKLGKNRGKCLQGKPFFEVIYGKVGPHAICGGANPARSGRKQR